MRVPDRLQPLLDLGVVDDVLRPLMSGKEAEIFLVLVGSEEMVAKVYKNSQFRSFQHRAEYTEGRRVRSTREARAMKKGSRHGRVQTEAAWQSAEVDAIGVLLAAGVRVPRPHAFVEGVLVMELVRDGRGEPAPRLVDVHPSESEATELFFTLLREVTKMLCAGIVHADLSDFNVLLAADGPVIIDFPQAVDPATNRNAGKLLIRDVDNLTSFLGRFAPRLRGTQYGREMWDLYERSELLPDTELTGRFVSRQPKAEVKSLLEDILELEREARERREALGLPPPRRARRPIPREQQAAAGPAKTSKTGAKKPPRSAKAGQAESASPGQKRRRPGRTRDGAPSSARPAEGQADAGGRPGATDAAAPKRRRRRRRKPSAAAPDQGGTAPRGDGSPSEQVRRSGRARRGGSSGPEGEPMPKGRGGAPGGAPRGSAEDGGAEPKRRRRRRGRRSRSEGSEGGDVETS
jgi:RIO kinase 1